MRCVKKVIEWSFSSLSDTFLISSENQRPFRVIFISFKEEKSHMVTYQANIGGRDIITYCFWK